MSRDCRLRYRVRPFGGMRAERPLVVCGAFWCCLLPFGSVTKLRWGGVKVFGGMSDPLVL